MRINGYTWNGDKGHILYPINRYDPESEANTDYAELNIGVLPTHQNTDYDSTEPYAPISIEVRDEVFLTVAEAQKVIRALQTAIKAVKGKVKLRKTPKTPI